MTLKAHPSTLFPVTVMNDKEVEWIPMAAYVQATVPAGATRTLDLGPQPGPYETPIHCLGEQKVMGVMLDVHVVRMLILSQLGLPDTAWCLLEEKRRNVLPTDPDGVPGDFDIIAGTSAEGVVTFDQLTAVEVKVRKVAGDGAPGRLASGTGTTQARKYAECGFDRVLLLHFLVCEPRQRPTGWSSFFAGIHSANTSRGLKATLGLMLQNGDLSSAPYGYLMVGVGQPADGDPTKSGAVAPVEVRYPPTRPYASDSQASARREEIQQQLQLRLGRRRPWAPFFRTCPCGRVFGADHSYQFRCGEC